MGIIGSPRRGGNTDVLVTQVLKGAEEQGFTTEKVYLRDYTINPCDACNSCFKNPNGTCKFDDDFESVKALMEKADSWVIGTPIYWWGPTAILKAFIDRWYQHNIRREFFSGKNLILVVVSGGGGKSYSRYVVGMMEDIAPYVGLTLKEKIICSGVSKRGEVKDRLDIMNQALIAGKNLS